jgi:hypothetical protein
MDLDDTDTAEFLNMLEEEATDTELDEGNGENVNGEVDYLDDGFIRVGDWIEKKVRNR